MNKEKMAILSPPMDSVTAKRIKPSNVLSELIDACIYCDEAKKNFMKHGYENAKGMELAISGLATDIRAKCEMIKAMIGD